jgi:predicted phage terminase large subunit-like protein
MPVVIRRADAAKELRLRREMRNHLSPFIKKVFSTVDPGAVYKHNWHIDYLSEYLEACWLKQVKNIIFNMPPRFMKSISISVAFSAWGLGRNPSEQFLCGSYSDKLSIKHSVDSRLVIESPWYGLLFPDTVLSPDQNEKSKFVTTKRGHRIATSVGGSATGEGGNFLITDDPMNPKKASSVLERETTNDWFSQTWGSRKNDPKTACEILVMQRLHENDTTGYALDTGDWEHIVIPQEAEKKTIIIFPISKREVVREEGDVLHPERIDKSMLPDIKKRFGTAGYAGQHQQRPFPKGGDRVKMAWFPRYRELPKQFDEIILSSDTAGKAKEVNDPSVIQVYGRKEQQWYFIFQWKKRVTFPDLENMAISMGNKWKCDSFLIEDKSSGISLIQTMQKKTQIPVIAIEPEADKVTRFDTQTSSLEAGLISLPDPVALPNEWMADIESNLSAFPNPNAWDELDAMSQFLKHLRKREERTAPQVRSLG